VRNFVTEIGVIEPVVADGDESFDTVGFVGNLRSPKTVRSGTDTREGGKGIRE